MRSQDDEPIYLDHNATTPVDPSVREAMIAAMDGAWGNPSSAHVFGRRAHDVIETARAELAALIGAHPDEIVFTSGGTESNNLAIGGAVLGAGAIVTSAIEHPAVQGPCGRRAGRERERRVVGVDEHGVVDSREAERAFIGAALVTIMLANNETGVIQPIAELARLARGAGALVHTDAAQAVGKVPVDVRELGVDLLTIAGHKLYAPKGVGALFVRRGVALEPQALGGSHEHGRRPGTENVVGIAGLGAAAALARRDLERESARVGALRDRLVERIRRSIPELVVHGAHALRLPSTASIRFPRASGNRILAEAPDVAASTGSACHLEAESPSAVITAMGVSPVEALGTVRISLGRGTREDDVDRAAQSLVDAWVGVVGA